MFCCPNCDLSLERDASVCPRCNASFDDEGSVWKPVFRPPKIWTPNEVPAAHRIWYALYCVIGLLYASHSLYTGSFYLPSRQGHGTTLRGIPAYIMCAAVFVGVAHLASFIVDHYDRRNNEDRYASFARKTKYWFFGLYVASFFVSCTVR